MRSASYRHGERSFLSASSRVLCQQPLGEKYTWRFYAVRWENVSCLRGNTLGSCAVSFPSASFVPQRFQLKILEESLALRSFSCAVGMVFSVGIYLIFVLAASDVLRYFSLRLRCQNLRKLRSNPTFISAAGCTTLRTCIFAPKCCVNNAIFGENNQFEVTKLSEAGRRTKFRQLHAHCPLLPCWLKPPCWKRPLTPAPEISIANFVGNGQCPCDITFSNKKR